MKFLICVQSIDLKLLQKEKKLFASWFLKIFKFDFLQKKFFRGHSEFCCKKDKKETMWNMNLVQQNFFSASKYMCMYLQTYI